jgi:D-alanyl-D-alanine carboxypeptidase/D-alanyl-D-alanine-endopeptidase (penicillin-binding protein 4)
VFEQNHTGFYLFDPSTQKVISDVNGAKYFTPASNTKIFTFYTSLRILGDSIPALKYAIRGDSLIVWGTGDPSFLNRDLPESRIYDFFKNHWGDIYLSFENYYDESFGPGWAWDDYLYYYQPEKAPFPLYGNVAEVEKKKDTMGMHVYPETFEKFLTPMYDSALLNTPYRGLNDNLIRYFPPDDTIEFNRRIPFRYTPEIVAELLSDTLQRDIKIIKEPLDDHVVTLFSIPADSLYKQMMHASDNFMAEQLMLMNAGIVSDSLQTNIAIQYSKDSLLSDLPDELIWRDGSGLSRYNLFTPRSIVVLWNKIYDLVPEERLFNMIAVGGFSGTLENWYKSDPPFIFGKTGTLSNNHSLSGFLRTKKGKLLIFSFMNNNYKYSSSTIKDEMEKILTDIYEKY